MGTSSPAFQNDTLDDGDGVGDGDGDGGDGDGDCGSGWTVGWMLCERQLGDRGEGERWERGCSCVVLGHGWSDADGGCGGREGEGDPAGDVCDNQWDVHKLRG